MSLFKLTLAAAALFGTASAAHAGAITVDAGDIGSAFTVGYDGFSDGNVIDGLTGQTTFTLTGVTGNSYTFDYEVANTSSAPIDQSRVSIFGFNTDPDIVSASSTGAFDSSASGNVPSGFGKVEVCFKGSGGPNCSGGGGDGVFMGDTAEGTLTLNFADAVGQLTLSDFFVRYQAIEGAGAPGSAIGRGTVSSTGGSTGGTPVPAPAGLALFAIGAAGLVTRRRRAA